MKEGESSIVEVWRVLNTERSRENRKQDQKQTDKAFFWRETKPDLVTTKGNEASEGRKLLHIEAREREVATERGNLQAGSGIPA